MAKSSRITNVLLGIIAVCLIAIAIKPAGVVSEATAQRARETTSAERFAGITATTQKQAQEQVDAVRSVASAIENLAKATEQIAKAIERAGDQAAISRSGAAERSASTIR